MTSETRNRHLAPEPPTSKALFSISADALEAIKVFEFSPSSPPTVLDAARSFLPDLYHDPTTRVAVITQKFDPHFEVFTVVDGLDHLQDDGKYELKYRVCKTVEVSKWETILQEGDLEKLPKLGNRSELGAFAISSFDKLMWRISGITCLVLSVCMVLGALIAR